MVWSNFSHRRARAQRKIQFIIVRDCRSHLGKFNNSSPFTAFRGDGFFHFTGQLEHSSEFLFCIVRDYRSLFGEVQQLKPIHRFSRWRLFSFHRTARAQLGCPLKWKKPISTCLEMGLSSCGEWGIRTPGTSRYNGFQDRRNRPLCQLSGPKVVISEILTSNFLKKMSENGFINSFTCQNKQLIYCDSQFKQS